MISKREKLLYERISQILRKEWDPIGLYKGKNIYDDEYNSYVPHILCLLLEGRDEYKISIHLTSLKVDQTRLRKTI